MWSFRIKLTAAKPVRNAAKCLKPRIIAHLCASPIFRTFLYLLSKRSRIHRFFFRGKQLMSRFFQLGILLGLAAVPLSPAFGQPLPIPQGGNTDNDGYAVAIVAGAGSATVVALPLRDECLGYKLVVRLNGIVAGSTPGITEPGDEPNSTRGLTIAVGGGRQLVGPLDGTFVAEAFGPYVEGPSSPAVVLDQRQAARPYPVQFHQVPVLAVGGNWAEFPEFSDVPFASTIPHAYLGPQQFAFHADLTQETRAVFFQIGSGGEVRYFVSPGNYTGSGDSFAVTLPSAFSLKRDVYVCLIARHSGKSAAYRVYDAMGR
jgi:hypothetical protein